MKVDLLILILLRNINQNSRDRHVFATVIIVWYLHIIIIKFIIVCVPTNSYVVIALLVRTLFVVYLLVKTIVVDPSPMRNIFIVHCNFAVVLVGKLFTIHIIIVIVMKNIIFNVAYLIIILCHLTLPCFITKIYFTIYLYHRTNWCWNRIHLPYSPLSSTFYMSTLVYNNTRSSKKCFVTIIQILFFAHNL